MAEQNAHKSNSMLYQICLQGHLNENWSTWFDGVTVTPQLEGTTLLTCDVADQAALHGLLRQIRDLGIPLISVNRIDQ